MKEKYSTDHNFFYPTFQNNSFQGKARSPVRIWLNNLSPQKEA